MGGGGMRSMGGGGMRSNNGSQGAGIKRRWDSSGGSSDQGGYKRPYQQNSYSSSATNGSSANGVGGFQAKTFRSYESKPAMSSVSSYQPPMAAAAAYGKFPGYPSMTMPPSLTSFSPIAAAVANYTFPPPQTMPPLPKN
jgi:hypothetical protein